MPNTEASAKRWPRGVRAQGQNCSRTIRGHRLRWAQCFDAEPLSGFARRGNPTQGTRLSSGTLGCAALRFQRRRSDWRNLSWLIGVPELTEWLFPRLRAESSRSQLRHDRRMIYPARGCAAQPRFGRFFRPTLGREFSFMRFTLQGLRRFPAPRSAATPIGDPVTRRDTCVRDAGPGSVGFRRGA